ncbi:MAG: phosphoribosylformylglycinamidine cyclo-ligase [Thermoplasmata archaeon]|nr:MAG: phosphoribosylformylglycinamidine cyclo-ligase [Thermoplasmata archaeon]
MNKTKSKGMTYARAGVNIDTESEVIQSVISKIKTTKKGFGKPLKLPGHFTGLVDFGEFALSLCTDGVGSKVLVANALKKWDTVGIDCIAMNVNDMICIGAKPIAFVDYFAVQKHDKKMAAEVGKGLAKGAEMAGVSIIGGEVATLPEIVKGFDLAGTCLGYIEKSKIITGENIKTGDAIIGLRSSGIHSNGLTLARKIVKSKGLASKDFFPGTKMKIGEELLKPTRIYVKEIMEVVDKFQVKGMAHITGGGLRNLPRLKRNVEFKITNPLKPQPVFEELQKLGNVSMKEMYQTFNMGMGFAITADSNDAEGILKLLKGKIEAKVVGEVAKGEGASMPRHWLYFGA